VVFVLAGLLFAASAAAAQGEDLRSARRTELTDLVLDQQRRVDAATRRVEQLREEVDRRAGVAAATDSRAVEAAAFVAALEAPAGLQPVRGPALTVTLDDAPPLAEGEPAEPGSSPDDLVVHQQDVQAVVNALWAGGAEAMQLMDQRVISTSAVRCVGNTLILQGRVYSPPFTVTAVGDVAGMRSALDASYQVQLYRQWVDVVGLGYDIREHDAVTLPAYTGSLALDYAEVAQR